MGAKGSNYKPDAQPDPVSEEPFSNSQEVVPVPLQCGERLVALRWITRVYKPFTKEAPMERPGKK